MSISIHPSAQHGGLYIPHKHPKEICKQGQQPIALDEKPNHGPFGNNEHQPNNERRCASDFLLPSKEFEGLEGAEEDGDADEEEDVAHEDHGAVEEEDEAEEEEEEAAGGEAGADF